MDERLNNVEERVNSLEKTQALMYERYERMHHDIQNLTEAVEKNTEAQQDFNNFMSNQKGKVAGALAILTLVAGGVWIFLGKLVDRAIS